VRRGKYCVGHDANDRDINAYDFYCNKCGTLEQKTEDEPDFRTWVARWSAPTPS
jgi:hypothetical protein